MPHDPKKSVAQVALLNGEGEIITAKALERPFMFEKDRQILKKFDVDVVLVVETLRPGTSTHQLTTRPGERFPD